ncbi:Protein FixA [Streptomyces griseoloalbus]
MSLRIVVTVKYVPDATGDRHFADDLTVDRDDVDGLLSELDEYAVEQALQIAEKPDDDVEVTVLTIGPEDAKDALRKALSMGADKAVHVEDDDLHGTDAIGTSLVLAKAVEKAGYDLVVSGMASTDGTMGVIPALLAERLGVPQVTLLSEVSVEDGTVTGRRDGDAASEQLEASLPAVVSVTDQSGEAPLPVVQGHHGGEEEAGGSWDLSDLGPRRGPGRPRERLDHGGLRRRAPGPHRRHDRQGRGRGRQAARRVPRKPEVHLRPAHGTACAQTSPPQKSIPTAEVLATPATWTAPSASPAWSCRPWPAARRAGHRRPQRRRRQPTAALAEHGTVTDLTHERRPSTPPTWSYRSDALHPAAEADAPAAVLVPSTANGKEIAARLAPARTGVLPAAPPKPVDAEPGDEHPVAARRPSPRRLPPRLPGHQGHPGHLPDPLQPPSSPSTARGSNRPPPGSPGTPSGPRAT